MGDEAGDDLPKVGYILRFTGDSAYENLYFQVVAKEPIEYTTGETSGTAEFSTVASGAQSGFKDITVLQSDKSHLRAAYLEPGFIDGMLYQFKMKSGTIRLGPDGDKNSARLNNYKSPFFEPDQTYGFWLFGQDWFPSINAINQTPWTQTPSVHFKGYKFEMVKVTNAAEINQLQATGRVTVVTLGGVPN